MAQRLGYLVDVSTIQLDEQKGSWIQAMRVGTYAHPVYGDLHFTEDRLRSFAASVNSRVLQKDLDIDYDHKARVDHAAGWVQAADVRDNGLWLYVTWTPKAEQMLRDKEYRYFSPEFQDEWVDPRTGYTYKDVLFGGALTNRPFLKDLVPINLSEMMVGDTMTFPQGGTGGSPPPTDAENLTQIARQLGLTGQVTSSDLLSAVTRLSERFTQQPPPPAPPAPYVMPPAPQPPQPQPQNIVLSVPAPAPAPPAPQQVVVPQQLPQQQPTTPTYPQQPQQVVQPPTPPVPPQVPTPTPVQQPPAVSDLLTPIALTDELTGDPVALADVVRRQNERLQLLGAATKLADAQAKIALLSDPRSQIALSPAVRELALELMVKAPVQLSETVEKLLQAVATGKATVVLGELGRSGTGSGNTIQQFSDAITKAQTEHKLSYGDALQKVARENPDLADAYRQATMSGEGES